MGVTAPLDTQSTVAGGSTLGTVRWMRLTFVGALLVKRPMPPAMCLRWNSSKVRSEYALWPSQKLSFLALCSVLIIYRYGRF